MQHVLVGDIQIAIALRRCENDCGTVLQSVLSYVLLNKVEVLLEVGFFVAMKQQVDFIDDNDYGNPQVNF